MQFIKQMYRREKYKHTSFWPSISPNKFWASGPQPDGNSHGCCRSTGTYALFRMPMSMDGHPIVAWGRSAVQRERGRIRHLRGEPTRCGAKTYPDDMLHGRWLLDAANLPWLVVASAKIRVLSTTVDKPLGDGHFRGGGGRTLGLARRLARHRRLDVSVVSTPST